MSASNSRRRIRLTNRSDLRVFRGEEVGELVVLQEEAHQSKTLNADGVELGEDQEHHLAAALSAAALRQAASSASRNNYSSHLKSSSNAAPSTTSKPPDALYHIPTPDATGIALNYTTLYPPSRWIDPSSFVRFSETVEETTAGPYGVGYGYTLDERDAEWLNGSNATARGEGTSAKAAIDAAKLAAGERGSRAKGKDKEREAEELKVPVMSEDEMELVMALMEKWTDDNKPFLHTDLSRMPEVSDFEPFFNAPIPVSYFPSYSTPSGFPPPPVLTRMMKTVYPHWRSRRTIREGRSIIPQLNYDETNDGDPYVCFRRRDVKPVRKTRRTDSQSVSRLLQLRSELQRASQIANETVFRERKKLESISSEKEGWDAKMKIIDVRRKFPALGPLRPDEDEMVFKVGLGSQKRQRVDMAMANQQSDQSRIQSHLTAIPHSQTASHPISKSRKQSSASHTHDLSPAPSQDHPPKRTEPDRPAPVELLRERVTAMLSTIEREVAKAHSADHGWDDITDSPYQPPVSVPPMRAYKPLLQEEKMGGMWNSSEERAGGKPIGFRLRRGRGGLMRFDRTGGRAGRGRAWRNDEKEDKSLGEMDRFIRGLFPDDVRGLETKRRRFEGDSDDDEEMDEIKEREERRERERRCSERWRYDDEAGVLGVGMGLSGLENEERLVIDEFEDRHLRYRLDFLTPSDHALLSVDLSHLIAAERAAHVPPSLPMPLNLGRVTAPLRVTASPRLLNSQPNGHPIPNGQPMMPQLTQAQAQMMAQAQAQKKAAASAAQGQGRPRVAAIGRQGSSGNVSVNSSGNGAINVPASTNNGVPAAPTPQQMAMYLAQRQPTGISMDSTLNGLSSNSNSNGGAGGQGQMTKEAQAAFVAHVQQQRQAQAASMGMQGQQQQQQQQAQNGGGQGFQLKMPQARIGGQGGAVGGGGGQWGRTGQQVGGSG